MHRQHECMTGLHDAAKATAEQSQNRTRNRTSASLDWSVDRRYRDPLGENYSIWKS
jgi:hypothetical protein